jgi:hypothetical protein
MRPGQAAQSARKSASQVTDDQRDPASQSLAVEKLSSSYSTTHKISCRPAQRYKILIDILQHNLESPSKCGSEGSTFSFRHTDKIAITGSTRCRARAASGQTIGNVAALLIRAMKSAAAWFFPSRWFRGAYRGRGRMGTGSFKVAGSCCTALVRFLAHLRSPRE